jgi:hypothetical protein
MLEGEVRIYRGEAYIAMLVFWQACMELVRVMPVDVGQDEVMSVKAWKELPIADLDRVRQKIP